MAATKTNYRNTKSSAAPPQVNDYGKVPPQAIELEEAVLGALMLEKDAYSIVCDFLKPDVFYKDSHRIIYTAIQALASKQFPVDMITVTEQLKQQGELDEIGGAYYIAQLTGKVTSSAHIDYHARILAQKYLARELIRFSTNIQNKAFDDKIDVGDLMQEAEGSLFEISQRNVKKDYTQINPVINDALRQIEIAANRPDGLSGVTSGFEMLDKITSGWQKSDLIIIAARPAMGKTAFVLSMAKNMAEADVPVALFSLEMSNVQLVNRLLVNVCEIPGEKIKKGNLTQDEWEQLHVKVKNLFDRPIYVDDTASLSIFELNTKARRLVKEHGVKCIIIDYLQLMNASGMNFGSREQEVSMISRSLKQLAKELDIPIIALSQLNRGVEGRTGIEGKRPQLSDLRESGAIEQDADMVLFIHRPEYYKITEDANGNSLIGKAEIIIAKHRNGEVTDVPLRFIKEQAKFADADSSVTASVMGGRENYAPKEEYDDYNSAGSSAMGIAPAGMGGFSGGMMSGGGEFDIQSPASASSDRPKFLDEAPF